MFHVARIIGPPAPGVNHFLLIGLTYRILSEILPVTMTSESARDATSPLDSVMLGLED